MRPFKFFFVFSLAVIVFFFVARVLVLALFAAAIMSVVFFAFRKMKNFFRRLQWDDEDYLAPYSAGRIPYRNQGVEPLFDNWEYPRQRMVFDRSIEVR